MNKRAGTRIKWWYWVMLSLACLMVVTGSLWLISPWEDRPKFIEGEIKAMVQQDLVRLGVLSQPSPVGFVGRYVGNGKWSGTSEVDYTYETTGTVSIPLPTPKKNWITGQTETTQSTPVISVHTTKRHIEWNFYEKSQTTEVVEVK